MERSCSKTCRPPPACAPPRRSLAGSAACGQRANARRCGLVWWDTEAARQQCWEGALVGLHQAHWDLTRRTNRWSSWPSNGAGRRSGPGHQGSRRLCWAAAAAACTACTLLHAALATCGSHSPALPQVVAMAKKGIHPEWHTEAKVICNGEEVLTTSGTRDSYTGACPAAEARGVAEASG